MSQSHSSRLTSQIQQPSNPTSSTPPSSNVAAPSSPKVKQAVITLFKQTPFGKAAAKLDELVRFSTVSDSTKNEYQVTDTVIQTLLVGEIRHGKNKKSGKDVVIKIQSQKEIIQFYMETFKMTERDAGIYAAKQFDIHEQITKLTGRHVASILKSDTHYLILNSHETCKFNHDYSTLDLPSKLKIAHAMANLIAKLHANHILHLNITRQSFIASDDFNVNLSDDHHCAERLLANADFAFAQFKGMHIPPEIAFGPTDKPVVIKYGKYTDVFALGMVFLELFHHHYYGSDAEAKSNFEKVKQYNEFYYQILSDFGQYDSATAKLICDMIAIDPSKRITMDAVMQRLGSMNNIHIINKVENKIAISSQANYSFNKMTCGLFVGVVVATAMMAEYYRSYSI